MEDFKDLERSLYELRARINKMLDNVYSGPNSPEDIYGEWVPALDMLENKDDMIIKLDLPGMTTDQIDLSIFDDVLIVKGERGRDSNREDENYHILERQYGKFARRIKLPTQVNADEAKASYKDGVLTVILPKIKNASNNEIIINP